MKTFGTIVVALGSGALGAYLLLKYCKKKKKCGCGCQDGTSTTATPSTPVTTTTTQATPVPSTEQGIMATTATLPPGAIPFSGPRGWIKDATQW